MGSIYDHVFVLQGNIVEPQSLNVPKHPRVLEFTRRAHDWKAMSEFNLTTPKATKSRKLKCTDSYRPVRPRSSWEPKWRK